MATNGSDQFSAAHHFLSGCAQAGMSRVIVSPGSRSTPLAVAALSVERLNVSVHLDERSASFAALGEAKVTGEPIGLVCTSGTAAANYLPAIAEAGHADVPLVALTADRPPEHITWGVGQSFVQRGLYGTQVRAEISMPVGGDGGLAHALRAGVRATSTARRSGGPVHVNWPFRLPLEPTGSSFPPVPNVTVPRTSAAAASSEAIGLLAELTTAGRHGIVVAGPNATRPGEQGRIDRAALIDFARHVGFPIVADVLSGLRGTEDAPLVDMGAHVLEHGVPECDVIVRVGDTPTAKALRLWWESQSAAEHVLLDPHARWHDPSHRATAVFHDDLSLLLTGVHGTTAPSVHDWSQHVVDLGTLARAAAEDVLDRSSEWSEAHLARAIGTTTSSDHVIVASSSMPIRDLDTFTGVDLRPDVFANRGINGIDGVIATSIGVARARSDQRVVVHIGDVALLHDLGSVLDAVRQGVNLTIVVPNNDGGGIFSFLPIRSALDDASFSTLLHTHHGTDLSALDAFAGVSHRRVTMASFVDECSEADARPGVTILEATVSTADHLSVHAEVHAGVRQSLGNA